MPVPCFFFFAFYTKFQESDQKWWQKMADDCVYSANRKFCHFALFPSAAFAFYAEIQDGHGGERFLTKSGR